MPHGGAQGKKAVERLAERSTVGMQSDSKGGGESKSKSGDFGGYGGDEPLQSSGATAGAYTRSHFRST